VTWNSRRLTSYDRKFVGIQFNGLEGSRSCYFCEKIASKSQVFDGSQAFARFYLGISFDGMFNDECEQLGGQAEQRHVDDLRVDVDGKSKKRDVRASGSRDHSRSSDFA